MKKNLTILSLLFVGIFVMGMVSAADAHIFTDTSDAVLLTIGTDGSTNATGDLMENSIKLSETYFTLIGGIVTGATNFTDTLNVTGNFGVGGTLYGDGSGLTGVTASIADNSTQIGYQNITNIPTCDAGSSFLSYDGTDVTCQTIVANGTTLDAGNITSGTFDVVRIPLLINATSPNVLNVTGIPTCTGDDVLTFDGTDMTCTTPVSAMDYTNVALINQTNTFAPQQIFTDGLNSDGNITIADTKLIEWDGGATISADSGVLTYKAGV